LTPVETAPARTVMGVPVVTEQPELHDMPLYRGVLITPPKDDVPRVIRTRRQARDRVSPSRIDRDGLRKSAGSRVDLHTDRHSDAGALIDDRAGNRAASRQRELMLLAMAPLVTATGVPTVGFRQDGTHWVPLHY